MIEIKDLTKKYHSKKTTVTALDNVNLKLPNTGFVAIYGENGCGKTTLLNVLSTADTDYDGAITYNGLDYKRIISDLRRNVISFVLQEEYFIPYLNLYDNIELFSDHEDDEKIDKELVEFSILDKKGEKTKNLSGGQRQRGSIIRGVIKKSEILLVDEPTSSLNEEMERAVFLRLREYAKKKLVVLVSHNIRLIRSFADLIIHMDKGKIISAENNCKTDIKYTENEILVPVDFCDLSVLDTSFIREKINNRKSILIKPYDDIIDKSTKLNYDISHTHTEWKPSKKISAKVKNKLISSSLKHIKGSAFFGVCLIALLAVIINFLFSFASFNKNEFVYQNISNNIEGYVNYKYDYSIYENKNNEKLDIPAYIQYKADYPTPKLLLIDYDLTPKFQFDSSGIYKNLVFGIAFCDENDVNLLFGDFCKEGEILLTDYSADALVNYLEKYTDYASIIELGVEINGMHFEVSGIVDTDYEKYKSVYFEDSFIHSQKYIDYQNSMQNLYGRIYYSLDQYLSCDNIYYLALQYGATFCNTKNFEKYDELFADKELSVDSCYINEALYNIIGDVDVIKLNNAYLNIHGVVKDNESKSNIYISEQKNDWLKNTVLKYVTSLMTDLSSSKEVGFLKSVNMTHSTSISGYINKVINIVTLTSNIFIFLTVMLATFLTVAIAFMVGKILSSDNITIALLKSSGYDVKSVVLLEICKIAIVFAFSAVISSLLYIASSYLLNSVLSSIFGYNISISLLDGKAMIYSILILAIAFIFVSAAMLISKNKKKIIDLINS